MRTYSKKEKMRQYLFFSLTKLNECVIQGSSVIQFRNYSQKKIIAYEED